ncbi:SAM-dependent methyltransferase [Mycolicibacterium sp. P9-64]|uniref:SAM-dependent methyltransferase n=1 Tax=Mycolicibacterium sp. P9-64 TaxID=2024612 RepID=UPI0011ED58B3|nr:SAM-dependent methyltransferase [Mycolicibacterium sp. P9-64]KAA0084515.1 SAM-dependent methyltransferase [Mycolicibacterium sp. P9-64]
MEHAVSNAAANTALGPMVIVAAEQHEPSPLIHDSVAQRLLPAGARMAVALTRFSPARRALVSVTDKKLRGGWASFLCRKRYIDDQLIDAVTKGIDAVVILGAGYDTRAYRLPQLAGIPICEVDLPANIARKEAALRRCFGRVPSGVTLLSVDFETDNLAERLDREGFGPAARTFYVWEAVTQYLTERAVRKTLADLGDPAPGSGLAVTYVRKDFLDGQAMYGAEAAYQDFVVEQGLWRFGLHPEQVADFLAEYGWREREQVGPGEYADRYLRPAGRTLTASEIERAVYAER